MKRPTVASLTEQINDLAPYQEFFFCRHETPQKFTLSNRDGDEHTVELVGAKRASGGVVLDGPGVFYATSYIRRLMESGCPYREDLAHRLTRATGAE